MVADQNLAWLQRVSSALLPWPSVSAAAAMMT